MDCVGDVRQGKIVGFRILLPDGDWLYLKGEVRHHTPKSGFGVQFVDLNQDQHEKLRALLTSALESGPDKDAITADLVEE